MWAIAARSSRALGLRDAAMPFLSEVHSAIRQHTQLGVMEGYDVLFIERLSARNAIVNMTHIGGRLPLHASSGGLVLLAYADQEVQEKFLPHPIAVRRC